MKDYRFRSEWRIATAPEHVYAALRDVPSYPAWWPQVRSVRQLSDVAGELTCRSTLPYSLRFVAEREVEDPTARVLQARLSGDLVGWSRWTVAEGSAVFEQTVTVGSALLRRLGLLVRPALLWNHERMMAAGEAGLRSYLT